MFFIGNISDFTIFLNNIRFICFFVIALLHHIACAAYYYSSDDFESSDEWVKDTSSAPQVSSLKNNGVIFSFLPTPPNPLEGGTSAAQANCCRFQTPPLRVLGGYGEFLHESYSLAEPQ
ncbi:MAG: hypothetical protein EA393_15675 [Bacteroidetes bacterium]|nr:MAG: hypothetical protein EA393_15675 [Bacteroidota bacterium]